MLDACVSYYHHHTLLDCYKFDSNFESFADLFRRDNILRGGYFPMLQSGWDRSDHPNMMVFTFEVKCAICKRIEKTTVKIYCHPLAYSGNEERSSDAA